MKKAVPWLYLALCFSQSAHGIEELLTGLWRWMPLVTGALRQQTGWLPILAMGEQTFSVANMVILTLMLTLAPFVFLQQSWAWKAVTLVALGETLNGVGHLSAALAVGGYFSGSFASLGLLLFSVPVWGRKGIFRKERTYDPR